MVKKDHYSKIYKRFKTLYPEIAKNVINHRPYDYSSIVITLSNGKTLIYRDSDKTLR